MLALNFVFGHRGLPHFKDANNGPIEHQITFAVPEELLFPACQSSRDCVDNVGANLSNPLAPHFIDCREPD